MKLTILKSSLFISTLLLSTLTVAENTVKESFVEYTLDNTTYRIPKSQIDHIETIIEAIETDDDLENYNILVFDTPRSHIIDEQSAIVIEAGGRLNTYSVYNTGYLNDFDAIVNYTCPSNMFIKTISSYHDNDKEDRRFSLQCAKFKTDLGVRIYRQSVSWSGYVNNYDQAFNYSCPEGKFLVGMYSQHDNGTEDRRFNFACAAMGENAVIAATLEADACANVGSTVYDQPWSLTSSGALIGMVSSHSNHHEDRTTQVIGCTEASDW